MTTDIYDKSIRFSFDEGQHKYTVCSLIDDKWSTPVPVSGVTSIISVINKEALVQWAANEASKHFVENLKSIEDIEVIALEARNAHKEKSRIGKAHGSVGHALIEALLKGKPVTPPTKEPAKMAYKSVRKAFEAWIENFKPEIIHSEYPFYSRAGNYAGTTDLICNIGGKLTLIDFKTTNKTYYSPDGIYADNFCQLGGYLLGLEEMLGMKFDEAAIVNLPKDGSEYTMKSLTDLNLTMTDAKLYFRNALNLFELNKTFNWRLK